LKPVSDTKPIGDVGVPRQPEDVLLPAREPPLSGEIRSEEASDLLPLWFQRGLVIAVAGVVSFGGFGLFLAVLGVYHFALVAVVGAILTAALSTIAWPRRAWAPTRRPGVTLPAIAMCVGALAFAGWNAHYAAHHISIGRDSGVYANTGKWIATHGSLEVPTGSQWASKGPGLTVDSYGTYPQGNHVEFGFDHLTPVMLAEADNLGGDGLMFRLPALLGALALCAVYAVGCRLVRRPWLVLAAVGALAFSLPQLNLARETFSEPAVEILLWSGMWLVLMALERRFLGAALLAGAVLTGTMLSRIDAPVYLVPLPVLAALAWLSAGSAAKRRWLARMFGVFLIGAVPVAVLGTVDVIKLAGTYYDDLHTQVREIQLGLLVSFAAAAVLVVVWPFARSHLGRQGHWIRVHRDAIATAAGMVVALALVAAWALRPAIMHPRIAPSEFMADLQRAAGLPLDPGRTYAEDSVIWLSWYLGPITIALAAIGAAIATARIIRRPNPTYVLVMAVAGIGTALYIWHPAIGPDQIWAMRRFVPAAMPLLVLLAALAISAISSLITRQVGSFPGTAVLAGGAAAMLVFPIGTTLPVGGFQPEANFSAAISAACRAMGPRAAVVTAAGDSLAQEYVSALRNWCNVPVAVLTQPFTAAEIKALADAWKVDGTTLWVLGSTPALVKASAPGLTPLQLAYAKSPRELEMTINRPPSHYEVGLLDLYGSPVAP
jgi:hypothetical protein